MTYRARAIDGMPGTSAPHAAPRAQLPKPTPPNATSALVAPGEDQAGADEPTPLTIWPAMREVPKVDVISDHITDAEFRHEPNFDTMRAPRP